MNYMILEDLRFFIYACDIETYDITYLNRYALSTLSLERSEHYGKCYKVLQGFDQPCAFCNNEELLEKGACTWKRKHEALDNDYLIKDHLLHVDGRDLRLECAIDISVEEEKVNEIISELNTERMLMKCIHKLISSDDVELSVSHILHSVLEFYRGDRAYIFEINREDNTVSNTFESCAKGVIPEIENLRCIPLNWIDVWIDCFARQRYIYIEDVHKIKDVEERRGEYETLMAQNIRSLISVPFYEKGELVGFLGVDDPKQNQADISFLESLSYFISKELEKNKLSKRLYSLSYTDLLTSVRNRNAYNEFSKNKTELNRVGVIYIDLNGLKIINDSYGHNYGDVAIKSAAETLKGHFDAEHIFRISGDEFLVILEDIDHELFDEKARRLQWELSDEKDSLASIGFAWEATVDNFTHLVYRTEQIMYSNKQTHYKEMAQFPKKQRAFLLKNIIAGILDQKYTIYLQPKMKAANGELYGVEALVRGIGEDGRTILPFEFIPVLEKERLISRIDYFVLEQSCACISRWKELGYKEISVSVNMSRVTMMETNFFQSICEICDKYKVPYTLIELEITETEESMCESKIENTIQELVARGFQVTIDDFGQQHSSFTMLMDEHISVVKLDRSLIKVLNQGTRGENLLEQIITLSRGMGKACVAEGVETAEQMALLKEIGCDYLQGYFFDKPLPVEVFEEKYFK